MILYSAIPYSPMPFAATLLQLAWPWVFIERHGASKSHLCSVLTTTLRQYSLAVSAMAKRLLPIRRNILPRCCAACSANRENQRPGHSLETLGHAGSQHYASSHCSLAVSAIAARLLPICHNTLRRCCAARSAIREKRRPGHILGKRWAMLDHNITHHLIGA